MDNDAPSNAESGRGLTITERLQEKGWTFDFFQAVWLLERHLSRGVPVGGLGPVGEESLWLRPALSMGFPSTDIRRIRRLEGARGQNALYRMEVTFMGLYGVSTPLPLHYAVKILRDVYAATGAAEHAPTDPSASPVADGLDTAEGSTPARDFLDILHHRLLSLFYRSWTKYRYHRTFGTSGQDPVTNYLLWMIGLRPGWNEALLGVQPLRMLRYAGVLTQHPRSAATLEGVLTDFLSGLPVRVEQFVGRWVALHPMDMNRIGSHRCGLGSDLTVGEQVYDLSGAFKVVIGPTDWETYLTFVPGQERYEQTRSFVRLYCGDPLAFGIEVELLPGQVPETRLTSDGQAGRLGFTTWPRAEEIGATTVTFDATNPTAPEFLAPAPEDPTSGVAA